jgi:hypothetical protein
MGGLTTAGGVRLSADALLADATADGAGGVLAGPWGSHAVDAKDAPEQPARTRRKASRYGLRAPILRAG